MTKKQEFINYVETLISNQKEDNEMSDNVLLYWNAFKGKEEGNKPLFTENGQKILQYLQSIPAAPLKAKDIADGMFISSRTVSGGMRKLVTDEYVEKLGQDPVVYMITEKGKEIKF